MRGFLPFIATFAAAALTGKRVTVKRSGHGFEAATFKGFNTDTGEAIVTIDGVETAIDPDRVRGYNRTSIVAALNEARQSRRTGGGRGNVDTAALHKALGKPPRPSGKRKATASKAKGKATAKRNRAKVSKAIKGRPAKVISLASAKRKAG